jgi:hypothetical protein
LTDGRPFCWLFIVFGEGKGEKAIGCLANSSHNAGAK